LWWSPVLTLFLRRRSLDVRLRMTEPWRLRAGARNPHQL
jgi:hypothetical protein